MADVHDTPTSTLSEMETQVHTELDVFNHILEELRGIYRANPVSNASPTLQMIIDVGGHINRLEAKLLEIEYFQQKGEAQ